ncbi:EAL domain-containing protein [Saccharopolyspora erythraea]|uniref:putative bifunctional diguanylate cyclase/phosphodiesterase n=1 Tax=Saccharopolyspora erythraea TaxID=1836 RepID=UPI001BAD337F|nr:EAL domain-containing protein [Saccharopolyspora erythraea]QUH02303.1 EAL domain-containing protein [Saccharopolyspora erythraea]
MNPEQSGGSHDHGVQASVAKVLAAEDMREYAIFSLDARGRVASWNAGAQRVKGYRSEEIIGKDFSVFYPRELAESGYPRWELEQAAQDGFFIDRGWRVRKDGSRFWAHVVITAQRSPDGVLDGFIKVTRDESTAQVREHSSRRQFTDLFELASTGIGLFDDAGRLLDANVALTDLLGLPLPQLRDKMDRDFLHPSDEGNGGLLPSTSPLRSPGGVGGPIPHRVLTTSEGEPVLCQVHSKASVDAEGGRSWLAIFHDVTEQVRRTEVLSFQATHDETTGLLNRRGFEEALSSLLAPDADGDVAVLFCDLDNFKRVNDALGHEAGDELLAAVADRLTTELPPKCTAARFYADQFVVVCPDVDAVGGREALTKHVGNVFRMVVPLREWRVHVSASVGSTVVQDHGTPITEILRRAEAAMIENRFRSHGRLQLVRRDGRPAEPHTDQLTLEHHLREALADDRIDLHYQPVIDNDGAVVMAEALLRWSDPELGPVTPDVALGVAERGGLLTDLDRCVLRKALHTSVGLRRPDGRPIAVSVNLSGLHPDRPEFVEEVLAAVDEAGADPANLVLEMVETVLAELGPKPQRAVRELVDAGVRFAMDDFGTGYSSLARLRDLPTQILKLDRMFVGQVCFDPANLGITRAVAELARTMRRQCIAEGVENATQHHLLRAIGIDAYQGFYFSPPLPAGEFRDFLATTPMQTPPHLDPHGPES